MKNLKLFSFLIIASSLLFVQCTSDPIPGPAGADGVDGVDGVSTGPGTSTTELLAKKVFLGPQIDGIIDASWENAQVLQVVSEVPEPGDNVFQGYVGQKHDVEVRAQYDNEYIYFLAQWKDGQLNLNRDTWYYEDDGDPATIDWHQESNKPVFDGSGNKTREAFYEDKFAMQWDINNTTTDWNSQTCFATCHTGLGAATGYAKHYTIAAGEHTDMWHWKSVRNGIFYNQFDDKNVTDTPQDDARHGDAHVGGGYHNNKQTLSGVTVPKYYIPGKEYYYWITDLDINSSNAKLITAVDVATGILTDEDGNTINPSTEIRYQRDGETTGAFGMPSVYLEPFNGSRGDIEAASSFEGNGWTLEWKRKLDTGNDDDVIFDPVQEYPFGLGVFDNAAIAHAITAFLNLKFEQ
ncbi:MAG: hypothetical protein GXO84_09335 [Chlorobi bacterium]|nr:hypothetical protein [Chlorobiota bacterium]